MGSFLELLVLVPRIYTNREFAEFLQARSLQNVAHKFSYDLTTQSPHLPLSSNLGCLDYKGVPVEVPNALARLSANLDPRNFDSSGLGPGSDVMAENCSLVRSEVAANAASCCIDDRAIMMGITNGVDRLRSVCYLSLNVFHRLSVNHFAILFSQNKIEWPERQTRKRILVCLS